MPSHQYKHPPIEEATCEFIFAPDPAWNFTVPGRLYELISADYPAAPREQTVIRPEPGAQAVNSVERIRAGTRVQFLNEAENRLVGCGRDSLSIHVQSPYEGWDEFRERIQRALVAYNQVLPDSLIRRIGVRYINRITVEGDLTAMAPLVEVSPFTPPGLRSGSMAFLIRTEAAYVDEDAKLLLTIATADPPPGCASLLVDIDVVWEAGTGPLSADAALERVAANKQRVSAAFESVITQTARDLFND